MDNNPWTEVQIALKTWLEKPNWPMIMVGIGSMLGGLAQVISAVLN